MSVIREGARAQLKFSMYVSKHLKNGVDTSILGELSDVVDPWVWHWSISFAQQQQIDASKAGTIVAILPTIDLDREFGTRLPVLVLHFHDGSIFVHIRWLDVRAREYVPNEHGSTVPVYNADDQAVFVLEMLDYVESWIVIADNKSRLSARLSPLADEVRQAKRCRCKRGPSAQRCYPFSGAIPGQVIFQTGDQPRTVVDHHHQRNAGHGADAKKQNSKRPSPHPRKRNSTTAAELARAV